MWRWGGKNKENNQEKIKTNFQAKILWGGEWK